MNKNNAMVMAALAAMGIVSGVSARDVTWTGAASGEWNTSAVNFKSGDIATAFQTGDKVTFDDSASRFNVNIYNVTEPSEVTVNANSDYTWNFPEWKGFEQTTKITKSGLGILKYASDGSNWFTGLVDIVGGKVYVCNANKVDALGNSSGYACVVHGGAELSCRNRNALGNLNQRNGANITLKDGGKLTFYSDAGKDTHGGNSIRSLTFDGGGTIESHCVGASDFRCVVRVNDYIAVTGSVAQTLKVVQDDAYAKNYQLLSLSTNYPVEFRVADVTGDDNADLIVAQELSRIDSTKNPSGYTKTGKGTLQMNYQPNSVYYPNGPIKVMEGTLQFAAQNSMLSRQVQSLYVNTNATLHYAMRNVSNGNCSFDLASGKDMQLDITIDHGTFLIEDPKGDGGHNYLGRRLYLDNATFITRMGGATGDRLGAFTVGELVDVKGENPFSFNFYTNSHYSISTARMHLSRHPATEFRIADITGDDEVDVTNNFALVDFYDPYVELTNKTAYCFFKSGLVKTGPGTICLTSKNSNFTGDVDVREGTLALDRPNYTYLDFGSLTASYLGDMSKEGRSINVWTNATLSIRQRNIFASLNGNPKDGFKTEVALRGGLMWLPRWDATCFGKLRYESGTIDYLHGNSQWGVIAITESLTVAGGKPLVLPQYNVNGQLLVLGHTNVVFDVANVSGDSADDLTIGLMIARSSQTGVSDKYSWGFTKRGNGTMRLNTTYGSVNGVDGVVKVEAGTLLADTPLSLSRAAGIVVGAGGYLGGTGTVSNVTLANGAGLAATKDQAKPLTINGNLAIPESGCVDIAIPAGTETEMASVPVASVSGNITGNTTFANWKVKINGSTTASDGKVWLRGKTLYAGISKGMIILLK